MGEPEEIIARELVQQSEVEVALDESAFICARLIIDKLKTAGFIIVPVEPTGDMWVKGRDAFSAQAERYHTAQSYEMASAISDRAPEKIYAAMLVALTPNPDGGRDEAI